MSQTAHSLAAHRRRRSVTAPLPPPPPPPLRWGLPSSSAALCLASPHHVFGPHLRVHIFIFRPSFDRRPRFGAPCPLRRAPQCVGTMDDDDLYGGYTATSRAVGPERALHPLFCGCALLRTLRPVASPVCSGPKDVWFFNFFALVG